MQTLAAFVCVLCAIAPTQAAQTQGLPEPYGHTANVSPHLPNQDREWYTEYRWKGNQKYQAQDGAITTQPVHAPIPEPEKARRREAAAKRNEPVKTLNNKGHVESGDKTTTATDKKGTKSGGSISSGKDASKSPGSGPDSTPDAVAAAKAKKQAGKKKSDKDKADAEKAKQAAAQKSAKNKKKAKKVWKDERYALPEPCGHTANVHPTNSNRDREWYTEYRWHAGTEYKPQDGAITEDPKPALRGIKATPQGDPCVEVH